MHPLPARFALLIALALALLALLVAGCSKKTPMQPVSGGGGSPDDGASLNRTAQIARVMQVQDANTARLMGVRDVIGTGTGIGHDGRMAILVLTQVRGVAGLPAEIDGVPVEERYVGVVNAYAKPGGGGPLQCGTSTGNDRECAAGTIGCVVLKGGTKYFLSNNHVFARENAASNGERIDAPGRYDAHPKCAQTPACATLSDYQPISFGGNNTIDCAIAQPVSGLNYTVAEAGGYTPTATVVAPFVGQAVKKTGRTSGLTTGTVQAVNVTIQVQYSVGIATFVGQIMTPGSFIRSGDSGSLMVESATNNPVGLCFAGGSGGSFENPIGPVLQRFSATVATQ